jgi:hypothetical protein
VRLEAPEFIVHNDVLKLFRYHGRWSLVAVR